MLDKLEVITIGKSKLFNREGTTWNEDANIIELQNRISAMVRSVKRIEDKVTRTEEANRQVTHLIKSYTPILGVGNIEQPIRELAKAYWQK